MQKIKHWRHLARDPVHTVGFMFIKVCKFAAGSVGIFKEVLK